MRNALLSHRISRKTAAVGLLVAASAALLGTTPALSETPQNVTDSAAAKYDWGQPEFADEFDGTTLDPSWQTYSGPGNGGNGTRDPQQIGVADGVMTQTGDADAKTAGMVQSGHERQFGRWEFRMRATATGQGGGPYHPVGALFPTGVDYHCGMRDLDFFEKNIDESDLSLFIHYPPGSQDYGTSPVDTTQWHTYGVEIAHDHITWFVDGKPTITDTKPEALPGYPLSVNFQLDANQPNGLNPAQLQVDYSRFYPLPEGDVPTPEAPAPVTGAYPAC